VNIHRRSAVLMIGLVIRMIYCDIHNDDNAMIMMMIMMMIPMVVTLVEIITDVSDEHPLKA